MPVSWSRNIWQLILIIAISSIIGLLIGYVGWAVTIGLITFIFLQSRQLILLQKWLENSLKQPPNLTGIWEDIAYQIYRVQQRSRRRKKRVSSLLKRFKSSTRALPDAAVVLGPKGDIEWVNKAATSLLGLKNTDIGQHIGNLVRNTLFHSYLDKGDFKEGLEIASPLDNEKTLDIRVIPYGVQQYLMLARDITHIQRLLTMRKDFAANVSHELRTPLTVIAGYLEALQNHQPNNNNSDQEWLQHLAKLESPTKRMQAIIDNLLLLSRLDTSVPNSPEHCPTVKVNSLIDTLLIESKQLSHNKHTITSEVQPGLNIKGTEQELYSIFSNLINNAIRYTQEDGIIKITWNESSNGAEFIVEDNGQGIAPEHLNRLTERFYRADSGRARTDGGTGLGLAIVKQALRRHDARLDIKSELNKGSQFSCKFPKTRIIVEENQENEPT